jgi:hypothetical protein
MSRYPTKWFLKAQNISVKMNDYNKHIALVNIFLDDMGYNKIGQIPLITGEALLGNLGGQIGLFMGISLLSTIEILELSIILYFYFHKKLFGK